MSTGEVVMEVPTSLKRLARLVVRGFYTIEDALIIDILVRNPCMKEDDMCELLKFERKMLRQRISILRSEKFLQTRLRMETGADGKAQKVNYYFINYKVIYFKNKNIILTLTYQSNVKHLCTSFSVFCKHG